MDISLGLLLDQQLHPIQLQRPFDSFHIEMVLPKNLQVPKFISQAQLVVGLKFVAVIRSTDTLQIFPAVRIPCSQLPDEPCRNDVIHMAGYSKALEVDATCLDLAVPFQSDGSVVLPSSAIGGCSRPF